MPYNVTTAVFEGPLDLLLQLITAGQVDLYEVSLASIVDGFLAEVARMELLDLEVATEFTLIASTLISLKCRRLLPSHDEDGTDEELGTWEERDLLLARLLECATFKRAGAALASLAGDAALSLAHPAAPFEAPRQLPNLLAGVGGTGLAEALARAIARAGGPAPRPQLDHVAPRRRAVAEIAGEVLERMRRDGRSTFEALTEDVPGRAEIVGVFLAILELYKRGCVDLLQSVTFGRLEVVYIGEGTGSFGDREASRAARTGA